ncbi:MAG: hypothetical protein HOP12_09390 [Candidatus Eisenbacteria bacterium]|uniref:Outer membrane protein beta-barrel domain-containing protein n=1 Tax=Eiseniibacteriota bacterium TaxID=2212470 RepID=A0A849SZ57_UNCEI|nr:hypothetical protein [Candidatus Eisenbacteria bacterium]
MMSRLGLASVVCLALLSAAVASAQESAAQEAPAAPTDTVSAAVTARPAIVAPRSGATTGRAGVAGYVGASKFVAAEDFSTGALPRFDFAATLRYVLSPGWRLQVSPGFTWSGYSKQEVPPFTDPQFPGDTTKEHYLALLTPVSAQLQYTWMSGSLLWHLGAGPGVYRVAVQNHRKTLQDAVTLRRHQGLYLGGSGELGMEKFLKSLPTTSVELALVDHFVLATRDDQFPSGWNSAINAASFRIGMNYYFETKTLARKKETLPASATGNRKKK